MRGGGNIDVIDRGERKKNDHVAGDEGRCGENEG